MSLKASRTPSKIDDICRFMAGVDDDLMFLTGTNVLDAILDGMHMPWGSHSCIVSSFHGLLLLCHDILHFVLPVLCVVLRVKLGQVVSMKEELIVVLGSGLEILEKVCESTVHTQCFPAVSVDVDKPQPKPSQGQSLSRSPNHGLRFWQTSALAEP